MAEKFSGLKDWFSIEKHSFQGTEIRFFLIRIPRVPESIRGLASAGLIIIQI